MKTVSIITPWKDHPELVPDYEAAVQGADEIQIFDTALYEDVASEMAKCGHLADMVFRLGNRNRASHHKWDKPFSFAAIMNAGIRSCDADIIVCLNNDIRAFAPWIEQVREQVDDGALYGPAFAAHIVDGVTVPYIEGWCIAATRKTWHELGGFDEGYERAYYEDADLSLRAVLQGMKLVKTFWPLEHLSNTTSKTTPGAYDFSERNRERFFTRVRCELGEWVIPETFKSGPPRIEFSTMARC